MLASRGGCFAFGIMIEPFHDALEAAALIVRPVEMPHATARHEIISHRPGAKWITSHRGDELVAAHADVAGTRRHGPGISARTALEQMRIVTAHPVYHLGDFKERDGPRAAEVEDALVLSRKKPGEYSIEIVAVSAGANLVKIERGGTAGAKARLNPVNGPRMAIEASAHRQRNSQDGAMGNRLQQQFFRFRHGFAVDRYRIDRIGFDIIPRTATRKNKIAGQMD